METKYAAHRRQRQRIKQFVRTSVEPVRKHNGQKGESILPVVLHTPPVSNKPPVTSPAENGRLPLFMEPLFKAKDFDPL